MTLDELAALGRSVADDILDERVRDVRSDDLATLVYTAGTTEVPKACELTHRNLLAASRALRDAGPRRFAEGGALLMFLPLTHIFGRTAQCAAIEAGMAVGYTSDIRRLQKHLRSFRPTLLVGVPAVFDNIYQKALAVPRPLRPVAWAADQVAVRWSKSQHLERRSTLLVLARRLFDVAAYRVLRERLGGRCIGGVCGGGPLQPNLARFYEGVGIPILEGYGLTESCGGAVGNSEYANRIGTVGLPMTGVTVKVDDEGRILLRGDTIFRGYWRNPEATRAVLRDGWLHTGDIGALDEEGFLTLAGNVKRMLVTTAAENVAFTEIEARLSQHPEIEHCVVLGHARPFATALITLRPDGPLAGRVGGGGHHHSDVESGALERAQRTLQAAVDDANTVVTTAHGVRKFRVLPRTLSAEKGEVGPDGRPNRTVVLENFRDFVKDMYSHR